MLTQSTNRLAQLQHTENVVIASIREIFVRIIQATCGIEYIDNGTRTDIKTCFGRFQC
ncbi:Uncharacterised protein [Vibrio cholerae]|nr:Uncharacterised protein [Vibrio cholerae]CSB80883.1 Uncharacterised protein [Vibrio cholerae]CSC51767.1 Uncharacterised protein [Vibrio cholerae]CSI68027.1 Uncharacterised protein [Vibrio cholerae]